MHWQQSDLIKKAEYLPALNRIEPAYRFLPETTLIDELPLPFYPGAKLLRVTRMTAFPKPLWYAKTEDEIVPLDGSVANINYLDETAPLRLTPENTGAYDRFRSAFGSGTLPDSFDF